MSRLFGGILLLVCALCVSSAVGSRRCSPQARAQRRALRKYLSGDDLGASIPVKEATIKGPGWDHIHQSPSMRLRGGHYAIAPAAANERFALEDGRKVCVFSDDKAISAAVAEAVAKIGASCIADKGAFSIAIPGGSVVKALSKLEPTAMDFTKVHVFFCNERIGEYKCYKGATADDAFVTKCGIPLEQVHRVSEGSPQEVAVAYTALLEAQDDNVCSRRNGLPSIDLVLLGTGADGHCASIYPDSAEVKATGAGKMVLPIDAEGKKSVTLSIDAMSAASHAILAAATADRASMVANEPPSATATIIRAPLDW